MVFYRRHSQMHFLEVMMTISPKFVSKGPINIITALVQVMACRRLGGKQLSEPMIVKFTDAYMWVYCTWSVFYSQLLDKPAFNLGNG